MSLIFRLCFGLSTPAVYVVNAHVGAQNLVLQTGNDLIQIHKHASKRYAFACGLERLAKSFC